MSTESGGNTENGLAVVCVVGVVIYLACKLKKLEYVRTGGERRRGRENAAIQLRPDEPFA